jgi:zinc transporter ZupT
MNTLLPILIVAALAVATSVFFHRMTRHYWRATVLAAATASAAWVAGVYLLLVLTAPNELGPPLLLPILQTFGTAMVATVLVDALLPGRRQIAESPRH